MNLSLRHLNRRALVVPLVLLLCALISGALFAGTHSAYTTSVKNNSNTVASNGYFTCRAAELGAGTATRAYLSYALGETVGTAGAADASTNGHPGVYSTAGITYSQPAPCPRDNTKAVTLNGSTGYITGPQSTTTTINPNVFTEEVWFKTTTGGGLIIGIGNSATGASGNYDRHIYLDDQGNVVFGVYPNAVKTVQSPGTYLDGKWHDAVATMGSATDDDPGMRLYVDGKLVASDLTTTTTQNFAGYVRIGYDNMSGWGATTPTNYFFTGSLAWVSLYNFTLSASDVADHYRAGI